MPPMMTRDAFAASGIHFPPDSDSLNLAARNLNVYSLETKQF